MFIKAINRLTLIPNLSAQKPTPVIQDGTTFVGHKQLMDLVDTDFYTGLKVPRKDRTTEHLKPKSKQGKNSIENYAMTERHINSQRSNMPLEKWLSKHPDYLENMKKYILKYWDLLVDGKKHGQEVAKTVKQISRIDLFG